MKHPPGLYFKNSCILHYENVLEKLCVYILNAPGVDLHFKISRFNICTLIAIRYKIMIIVASCMGLMCV